MLHLCERVEAKPASRSETWREGCLTLSFEDRRKSRLRACLDDGREAAILLPRGTQLRDGEYLLDDAAKVAVCVKAAMETLSVVRTADLHLLVRAAYHLGNRHVPVQLGQGWLAYRHDHVLDGLVCALGLTIACEEGRFEPEAGGYAQGPHEH
jgi:urease accessory protein